MPPMPLIEELPVHSCLTACLMDRELGWYSFYHSNLGVFTDILIKLSKRHNNARRNASDDFCFSDNMLWVFTKLCKPQLLEW